jgi:peptidoglycan/LPS O-acetylase OafA/YrhL
VIRRIGRMVPVMWLSILFAVAVLAFAQQRSFPGTTPWFNSILATPTGLREVLLNLAGVHSAINSPLWSVQIELEIAPFLPLLVWLADRFDPRVTAPVFIALCYASLALWAVAPNAVLYAYCLYLGIALPKIIATPLVASIMRQPATLVICLLILLPLDWGYCTGRLWMPYKFIIDAIVSAEIIGFILLRPESRFSHALLFKPLVTARQPLLFLLRFPHVGADRMQRGVVERAADQRFHA